MFVLPLEQTGIDIQPLIQMTGEAEFNQIFLEGARIPRSWVVGEVNDGWRMAVALLAHERIRTGQGSTVNDRAQRSKSGRVPIPSQQLIELAQEKGRTGEPIVRQELANLVIGERIIEFIRRRNTVHPSIGKLWRTRQGRAAAHFAARICFPASPAWSSDQTSEDYFQFHILNCRGMSLGGGTDEIQRNTIGERVLGLPREPGSARDTPFRSLPRN
jgi:alkylation response protein AidB-like acyl-CoA dehydrogenase